jgi:hypothetical protein
MDTNAGQAEAQPSQPANPPAQTAPEARPYGVPPELTVKAGTLVTVRVNEELSSNRNHAGDSFSVALTQPLVVDGVVVAGRGQTAYGRVVEATKASGGSPSHLGLELTEFTLVDGAQTPLRTQLMGFEGGTEPGRQQAGTVIGTTEIGAIVGAAAGRGAGAAIGAGAGAAAGTIAILMTRKRPTVIYPETALTFRIESPITVNTTRAPQAFRYVDPNQYARPVQAQARTRQPETRCDGYGCAPLYPYWGPMYSPYPYPYYWGPYYGGGLSIMLGRGGYRRWR